jgi:hypothetical protein
MASGWSKDKRPARKRYWERHTLEKRKVRNILINKLRVHKVGAKWEKTDPQMTKVQARRWWQSRRKGRVPADYLPLTKSI